jgi:Ca2+-dependent lipid-binding protein
MFTETGILRVTVHAAKGLAGRDLNPYYKLALNDKEEDRGPTKKRTNDPSWQRAKELLVFDKGKARVSIKLFNETSFTSDPQLGYRRYTVEELLDPQNGLKELVGNGGGRVHLSATWHPVAMTGSINGASVYKPPLGVVRLQ